MTHAERLRLAVAKDVRLRMRTGGMLMVADGVFQRHIRVLQLRTWTDGPENETGSCNLRNAILVRDQMRAIMLKEALLETSTGFGVKRGGIEPLPLQLKFPASHVFFPRPACKSVAQTCSYFGILLTKTDVRPSLS